MTTDSNVSEPMFVAQSAYSDADRPKKADIENDMTSLKDAANGYATYKKDMTGVTDLNELLEYTKDNGYAGLTDEQINIIVDYRAEVKATQQAFIDLAEQHIIDNENMRSELKKVSDSLQSSFDAACDTAAKFQTVNGDGEVTGDGKA